MPDVPRATAADRAGGGGIYPVAQSLRVPPGQRYVGRAQWQGREVLAKLLVGDKAERHFVRELRGVQLLAEQGLKTPELLVHGSTPGGGGWLLFEFLDDAESLGDAWQAVAHLAWLDDARQQVLGEALAAIAGLHRQGLWQEDLHLDNLLRQNGSLYLIDGGGVRAETRANLCRETGCWSIWVCSSLNSRVLSIHSSRSCWCITCWSMASTRCRSRLCSRR